MVFNRYTSRSDRQRKGVSMVLAFVITLAACTMLLGTSVAAMRQTQDPIAVITAFNAAVSNQDREGALAYLDPAFRFVSGPGTSLPTDRNKANLLGQPPFQRVEQANIQQIDANTVKMDVTFIGGPMPVLPHPFVLHATFTVKNGLITQLMDQVSAQTAQDLAALAPPPAAMPNTGVRASLTVALLLALSVLCALAGTATRRASLR